MRWEDERYVRVYTRDTIAWKRLPWQSRALMPLLLRVVDRAGIVDLESFGAEGLADLVLLPVDVVAPGLDGLLADGSVELRGQLLVVRNFLAAQEVPMSDAQRKREQRARDRAAVMAAAVEANTVTGVTKVTPVTDVTSGHEASRLSHSVPCLSEPSVPLSKREDAHAGAGQGVDVPKPQPFAALWGAITGELMPPAYEIGKVRESIAAYAQAQGRPFPETADSALAAFREEVASWANARPLTADLFLRKWGEIQARMAGKVPKGGKRDGPRRGPLEPMPAATESKTEILPP